jgi:hypothetical protein
MMVPSASAKAAIPASSSSARASTASRSGDEELEHDARHA